LGRACSPPTLCVPSLTAIGDPPAGQIVRRELDVDVVAGRDADAEAAQTAREAREDRVAVLELDLERRAGKRFDDAADQAQRVFFDDGGQGLAALLAAAALPSARWGNGNSLRGCGVRLVRRFAPAIGFAREDGFRRRGLAAQRNFPGAPPVVGSEMITSAIVFGMVGVAAGFTWDYVVRRGE
jgi:hypothetical protein